MPVFTVPTHESNTCHEPAGSAHGGEFCASDAPSSAQFHRVPYLRNTVSSTQFRIEKTRFQQHLEPAGQYFIADEMGTGALPSGWERGVKTFQNPLVVTWSGNYDQQSWKAKLQRRFGKTGKALTAAMRKAGYDAVVTLTPFQGQWVTSEMVDLTVVR